MNKIKLGWGATKLLPMMIWWTFWSPNTKSVIKKESLYFTMDQKLKTLIKLWIYKKNVSSLTDVEHVIVLICWRNLQAEKKSTSTNLWTHFWRTKRRKGTRISERVASAVSIRSKTSPRLNTSVNKRCLNFFLRLV